MFILKADGNKSSSNQESDAFVLTEHVAKKSGLLLEYKKDGTPEGVARIENLEELLNGIKDFVEGQRELADAKGDLTEFLVACLFTNARRSKTYCPI